MATTDMEKKFSGQWRDLVSSCCDSLEQDDLRQVPLFNTWEDVEKQVVRVQSDSLRKPDHQEFSMLTSSLKQLWDFTDFFANQIVPKLDTSTFWGQVALTIKLQDEGGRVPRMLPGLCHSIERFNNYCSDVSTLIPEAKEACFEVALRLLSFFSSLVKFMRLMRSGVLPDPTSYTVWQFLGAEFTCVTREIDDSVSRIEGIFKISKNTKRSDSWADAPQRQSMPSLSEQSFRSQPEEHANLPCVILPSIRTSCFFERTDVISKIEEHFSKVDTDRSFRSLALYGPDGVGKSSIGLCYVEAKLRRSELDAMFWVHSQKPVTISQSFTDIALRLELPDARLNDHDENHALVLNWLQHTQCRWLIVYDNVESVDLLLKYWPTASRGQALITTRNRSLAFNQADGGLEIKTWDTEMGSRFLLPLLTTEISVQLTDDEAKSAHEISQELSGHALAISHMAGLIQKRAWSIAEFADIYNQQPGKMYGISGHNSINAPWDVTFKSLDPQSCAILGVLCFVAPDSVPQALFEPESAASLPKSLAFCSDRLCVSGAVENLLTLALIKRDETSRTLSVHRLVQTSFKYSMTREQRQQSFNNATILVSLAFPRRDSASAQLYLMWTRCALYLEHVLSLKDCFREEIKASPAFTALKTYCELNNACQRYLLEINAYPELEDLVQVNTCALGSLDHEDQTIGIRGSLTSHRGQLFVRLGRGSEGVKWLKESYNVRTRDIPFNPRESAWAAENAGNGIATTNAFSDAIKWHELARDHWLEWSKTNSPDKGVWPAVLKKSMGTTLLWAGQREQARDLINQAMQQIESTEPYSWAMAAYTHFALGTLDRQDRDLDSAEAHFMEAQNLWLKGDQLRTDPFNAACMYRMGCVALDQGKLEAAVKHLRDAMVVTEMRKDSMMAEHARCVFKLSEALQQEPREEAEAAMLHQEAEHLLRQLSPERREPGLEKTYDALVNILWS